MKDLDLVEHKNKESKSGYPHDKKYIIHSMNARMKRPDDGKWIDAVVYSDNEKLFIREKNDFIDKFKVVGE